MISDSEDVKIIFDNYARLTIRQDYATMTGITFSSKSGYYTEIHFDYLRELIIQDCNFQELESTRIMLPMQHFQDALFPTTITVIIWEHFISQDHQLHWLY